VRGKLPEGPTNSSGGSTIDLDPKVRVRFAPSPTGSLHIGSARTALYNFLFARHNGGRLIVRSEDTDAARSETHLEEAILADLRWLGLEWDEGPDRGGPVGPYRQSERGDSYRETAQRLVGEGHAYHCFCSQERLDAQRVEALAQSRMPKYDRSCHGLSADEVKARLERGERAALRLEVPEGEIVVDDLIRGPMTFHSDVIGDFIIVRSDGMASYNFAAAVDDAAMGITHVIRGDDHLTNTARQLLVLRALGTQPDDLPRYAHNSLILGADGGKLSKRQGAVAVGDYRELGYLPQAVVNYLALLSWSHGDDEVLDLERLVDEFELDQLSSSPAVFDVDKLGWLNHQWIMASTDDEHLRRVAERLPAGTPPQAAAALAAALRTSLHTYGEVAGQAAAVLERPALDGELLKPVLRAAAVLAAFRRLRAAAPAFIPPEAARELLAAYRAEGKAMGLAPRDSLMPLRIALTGREHGPELPFVLAALERDETLARIDAALATAGDGPAGHPGSGFDDQGDAP
jgi:nondiscriminating glutamyl-tRNA synthetase